MRYEKLDNIREILEHDARTPLTVVLAGSELVRNSYSSRPSQHLEWSGLCKEALGMRHELDNLRAERFTCPERVPSRGMSQLAMMRNCETMLEEGAKKIMNSALCVKEYCEKNLGEGAHEYVGIIRDSAEEIMDIASMAASGYFLQDAGKRFS